jgi:ABC-type nitrate/sulfonate/bicarbonate transport system substrate-binding protein
VNTKSAAKKAAETRAFLKALNRGYDSCSATRTKPRRSPARRSSRSPRGEADARQDRPCTARQRTSSSWRVPAEASKQVAKFFKDKKVNDTLVDTSTLFDASYLK